MKRHLISPPRRGRPLGDNPLWYKDAIIYEARVRSFFDSNNDGIGDFRGLSAKLDYLAGPRRHGDLAAAVLSLAAARRRLRHRRLHRRPPRLRHARRLRRAPRGGAPARPARHHRAGPQPHLRPAPLVPARAARAGRIGRARLLRLERDARALPRGAHHLQGLRVLELVLGSAWRAPTTGTASTRISRISTSRTRRCTRRCSSVVDFWFEQGRRRPAARRRPVPLRGGGDQLREPPRDARVPARSCARTSTASSRTGCCSPRRTSGPRTPPPTSATATSAT